MKESLHRMKSCVFQGVLFAVLGAVFGESGIYIDLCADSRIGCCPDGSKNYWFMRENSQNTINDLHQVCINEGIFGGDFVYR